MTGSSMTRSGRPELAEKVGERIGDMLRRRAGVSVDVRAMMEPMDRPVKC